MLEAKNIRYQLRQKALLDDISLTVGSGELVAIIGANGAGKSTLLKLLSRELMPSQGAILLDCQHIGQYSALELARRRAVLMQQSTLTFNFSVYELVMMGRYPHFDSYPHPEDLAIAEFVLEQIGIAHLANRSVPTLSGGEQQRVHLAKTLAQLLTIEEIDRPNQLIQQAKYLLLDEPMTGLDLFYQHSLLEIAQGLIRRGYAVITILHDLNLVMQYASKVLLLKDGRVLVAGQPATVLTPEVIRDAFQLPVHIIHQPGLSTPFIVPSRAYSS